MKNFTQNSKLTTNSRFASWHLVPDEGILVDNQLDESILLENDNNHTVEYDPSPVIESHCLCGHEWCTKLISEPSSKVSYKELPKNKNKATFLIKDSRSSIERVQNSKLWRIFYSSGRSCQQYCFSLCPAL